MNKQINPTIKAHLLRSAYYVLLLLAVCVIPFALAQRNSKVSKQSAAAQYPFQKPDLPRKANPNADSVLNHVQSQPAGQAQSRPVLQPHQVEGIDCDSEPGIIIHDDGGIENGYSGAPGLVTEVRFVDKFTPSSYPASFTSVCLDFVILPGGPATYPVDVVVYDDDGAGGSPGTLLGELNGQTATTHLFSGGGQAPIWNSYDISSLGINVTSGSVYIGTRYVPPANNVFTSADESGSIGFAGGYWWNNFDGVWSQTQNAFGGYHSMFIRAVESGGGGGTPTPTPTPGCIETTFTNPTVITIPDSGPASPYPSDIVVAGLSTVQKVTVTINGLTHTFPADLDFLLVGPAGQNAIIWSDAGGSDDVAGIVVTLDDDAATPLPEIGPLVSGTFQPANYGTGDTWPAPAPVPSGDVALSTFNGTDPNGTWSLYLVDDAGLDLGEITGGWELTICSAGGTPTPTPTPGRIVLRLNERRGNDTVLVRLRWTGANTNSVKIFRNGAPIARVPNMPNTYTDTLTEHGIFTYQVCEVGTGNCSNEKSVRGP
jgi:subtilisin-like proprotein convertase family protein